MSGATKNEWAEFMKIIEPCFVLTPEQAKAMVDSTIATWRSCGLTEKDIDRLIERFSLYEGSRE